MKNFGATNVNWMEMHVINNFIIAKAHTCKNNKNLIERETLFCTV
jgi:hypothetical protein